MKKFILLAGLWMAGFTLSMAQTCSGFYYFNNNEVEMTLYDKSDKENGKVVYKISNVRNEGGNTISQINSKVFNEKGKELTSAEGKFECRGGILAVNMKMLMPSDQGRAVKMDAAVKDVYLEYPSNMSVGSTLKDGEFSIDMSGGSPIAMSMTFRATNRRVESRESVTSPAGTWECFKITSEQSIKTVIGINFSVVEWFAPGFGVVKSETYNKGGKKMGATLLTKISK
jgi:hypothetical protein